MVRGTLRSAFAEGSFGAGELNEQIDRMQEKEQENRKNTNTTKEKAGKLEEILPSGKSVRTQTQEQESIEHQKVQQEEQHMSVEPSS